MQVAEIRSDDVPVGLLALQVQLDEVDEDPLEVLDKLPRRLEAVHLVLSPPATAICLCSHAPMILARGTYVCAADTNIGLQLAGIFAYRLAGRSVGTSLAILRWAIARARPIM